MSEQDRLAAHERLSTERPARWMRACASHPWRVVSAGSAIIGVVVVLVATGRRQPPATSSRSPARTRRTRTDSSSRSSASGAGLRPQPRLRGTRGRAASTRPSARRRSRTPSRSLKTPEFTPDRRTRSGIESVGDPFSDDTFSEGRAHRLRRGAVLETIETADRDQVVAVEDAVREAVAAGGRAPSSSTATPSSRRSSRARRSCSACSRRSSCSSVVFRTLRRD